MEFDHPMALTVNVHRPHIEEVSKLSSSGGVVVHLGSRGDSVHGVTLFFKDVNQLGQWITQLDEMYLELAFSERMELEKVAI